MKTQIGISLLVALTGCASAPRVPARVFETDSETAAFVSTELDNSVQTVVDDHDAVTQRLGAPMAKAYLRSETACGERWVYSRPTMIHGDPKLRILLVDFDASGLVCQSVYRDE